MSWLILILTAAACGGLLLARRRLLVVTVTGDSMIPTYHPGDRVLVLRTRRIRRGRVAVSRLPAHAGAGGEPADVVPSRSSLAWLRREVARSAREEGLIVKRVAAIPGDDVPLTVRAVVTGTTVPAGKLVLIGDGRHSADSRVLGFSSIQDVVGVVVAQLHRAAPPQPPPPTSMRVVPIKPGREGNSQ